MSQMDAQTQRELTQFLEVEQQKARFQAAVHQFTELCFPKCVLKPGNKLEKSEEACLANCVDRFLDTTNLLVQRLEDLRH